MHKPLEEYYLHDNGDGNGWTVASKGPGKFSLCTIHRLDLNDTGVIELEIEQYTTGLLNSTNTVHHMISPEEARALGEELIAYAGDGENVALTVRDSKIAMENQNKKMMGLDK